MGSEMCIRDRVYPPPPAFTVAAEIAPLETVMFAVALAPRPEEFTKATLLYVPS